MSDRNSSDYFNLDNFDEGIDSREYRRRRPDAHRTGIYDVRPTYNRRRPRKRRNRRRTRNRIVIVMAFVLVLVLLITLIVAIARGCGKSQNAGVSTDTKPATTAPVESTTVAAPAGDKLSPSVFIPANPADDNTSGVDTGTIYVWDKQGFELFGGSEETGRVYAETVNDLAGKLPGINVYSMIVPNHTEMGLPARLKSNVHTNSQADCIKAAYASMDTTKVKPVNAYNYLSEHCNEYTYFRSDHHWTGLGAYYAYAAFADTLGVPVLSLKECTEQKIEGFTGSFTSLAQGLDTDTVQYWLFPYTVKMTVHDESGNVNNYNSPYFEGEESGSLSYGVFIYGDNPLTVLKSSSTSAQQGRKIAVIKESYGNAFVPYLTNNYQEVHIMDMRTFRTASPTENFQTYCQNNGITDVLFLNGVMSANNGDLLSAMSSLFN